jgi:hypothetical protein
MTVDTTSSRLLAELHDVLLRRNLHADDEQHSDVDSQQQEFSPAVFWSVNAFLLFVLLAVCSYCWCCGGFQRFVRASSSSEQQRVSSDVQYRMNVLRRQQEREDAKKETPEERKEKLLQSFQRLHVSMVRLSVRKGLDSLFLSLSLSLLSPSL